LCEKHNKNGKVKKKTKKAQTLDRFKKSDILIGMMKTALQQNSEKKHNLQGLPCVATVSSPVWHMSYNKFNDTSIEGSGGRS